MSERWIVIPRWDEFQHPDVTRSDSTPWIRVYTRLLDDPEYLDLTPVQKATLFGLWITYAKSRRNIPENTSKLSRKVGVRVTKRTLAALNHAGFIEFSASRPQAQTRQSLSVASKAEGLNSYAGAAAQKQKPGNHKLAPDLLDELLQLKGADESTPAVLAGFARRGLPEAAFRNALEATHHAEVRGTQIGYLVGTLQKLEKNGQYR